MDKTIGNLGLTNEQEDQLVAFLKTLTDGYKESTAYKQKVPKDSGVLIQTPFAPLNGAGGGFDSRAINIPVLRSAEL